MNNTEAEVCVPVTHSEPSHPTSSPVADQQHVDMSLSESTHLSRDVGAKPSPVKVKPTLSAKPEKPKKPCLVSEGVSVKSDVKHLHERPTQSASKNNVPDNSSDFQLTEESVCSLHASEAARNKQMCDAEEKKTHSNDNPSHIYHVYDITAKGMSGTPKELEADKGTVGEDRIVGHSVETEPRKCRTLPVSVMRVLDVAEEHVAMPYNVVDVTLPRPSEVAAPSSDTPAATTTWPCKPQPAKRQIISRTPPKPRERGTQAKEEAVHSSDVEVLSSQGQDGCAMAKAGDIASKTVPSDLSERYAHRIYEDIDEFHADESCVKMETELTRQTAARSSVSKSPAFEAKIAALASLNLGKPTKPVTTVAPSENPPEECPVLDINTASSIQDPVVVAATKPEKSRKSGGKTFLQKFLKFGSKNTSEPAQDSGSGSSDEASLKVVQISGSSSPRMTNFSDDATSCADSVPSHTPPLTDKQAMLMNLKDCLAKRQTSDSSEISVSPVHSRTRSSEPTQSSGSVQAANDVELQTRGNEPERNEKDGTVVVETLPAVDSQASCLRMQRQSTSTDISVSPLPACKQLSDTDNCLLQTTDKQDDDTQRLEVKDLTVVTDDAGAGGGSNLDCCMSTCSSDAVSPTPSDMSVSEACDHSLKHKTRADRQGSSCMQLVVLHSFRVP